ncbi:carbon-nitrogen hydrolase family protein [Arthrobacter sp. JSM 101049]|uniref:carbon-nitrogen hydrolase family protein n=1 Tax=Arthrobacter sp. JSM 101049 TaxID=929097 RepID=UPI003562EDB7
MRIAVGQMASGHDVDANLRSIDALAARASGDGARLLVLPEYATYEKKAVDATFLDVAEPLDGPICSTLAHIAAKHSIALVAGMVEAGDAPGQAFNTLVAVDPSGRRLAAYRKVHLFDAQGYAESDYIQPAPDAIPVTFELDGVRFGLQACYDLRFPEQSRSLVDAGADVLLVCASWVPGAGKTRQWQVLAAARAIENGCFVVAACQAAPISVGYSAAIGPLGDVLGELGPAADLLVVDIDPSHAGAARERFPVARQRRFPA